MVQNLSRKGHLHLYSNSTRNSGSTRLLSSTNHSLSLLSGFLVLNTAQSGA